MYRHPNLSASSSSSVKRLSSNNPFRSALLEENTGIKDAQYTQWMQKRIEEESESDADSNSFSEGDDVLDFTGGHPKRRPRLTSRNSDSTVLRRKSTNPFTEMAGRKESVTKESSEKRPSTVRTRSSASDHLPVPPTYNRDTKPVSEELPPTYEEAVGKKYARNEYPKDVKEPADANPFPTPSIPRRAKTVKVSSHSKKQWNGNGDNRARHDSGSANLNNSNLLATTQTEILPDGRIRSKSVDESSPDNHRRPERPHRHHHHHHHRHGEDDEHLSRHRSSRKKFVMEKPKNLDTIDKLDVTGFYGGAGFHHDGPFDACTPHRNKDNKQAPVLAFPPDGPNNSIRGMGPVHTKEDQYDMVFGLSEEDPLYSTKISSDAHRPLGQASSQQQQVRSQATQTAQSNSTPQLPQQPHYYTGKTPYGNGVVVKKASASAVRLNDLADNPTVTRFDVNTKSTPVHGDTTLGLGSSTFLDGAPASSSTQKKAQQRQKSELSRKKSILDSSGFLRRVKSLKVRKSSRE
ncbi:DEKNAAC102764 [Brettanomyces naardenensis]|uniref:DEKNAAC102765 n=1 Tax=Brettanomyces naardenensis TaxID=13370 RepID=A0A448YKL4_BRENA|nr:DEKNAAC102764 [Brettanomyces naardenensis]